VEAEAEHLGGETAGLQSPFVQFLMTRNAWLFLERHSPTNRATWLTFLDASLERAIKFLGLGTPEVSEAILAGVSAARRRRYGAPPLSLRPAPLERLLLAAPWKSRAMVGWLSGMAENWTNSRPD
jgi:hypothetical protein